MFTNETDMKTKLRNVFFAFLSFFFLMSAHYYSDELGLDKIKAKFEQFNAKYPLQQIYVQTDRDIFSVTETMWLKAYLRRGEALLPDTFSVNLYIDIINWQNKIVMSKLLKIEKGIAYGEFTFPATLPDGNYTLRAFTNSMRNFDNEYFFSKQIRIKNPDPQYFTTEQFQLVKRNYKKTKKLDEKFDIQFMPEGGDLLADKSCVLAFKAINDLEQGVEAQGEVIDEKGKQVAVFSSSHLGMGKLTFTPSQGKTYRASVRFEGKKAQVFDLPEVKQQGFAVQLDNTDEQFLNVHIVSNLPTSLDKAVSEFYVLIHSAGKLLYLQKGSTQQGDVNLKIDKQTLGQGVHQLTLINAYFKPECERLFYIDKHDDFFIELSGLKNSYKPLEKVEFEVNIQNNATFKNKANLSVALVSKESFDLNNQINIKTYFDLKSKLSGKVENIAHYFEPENKERFAQLDLLLLTQAWRRYEWTQILNQTSPPKYYEEEGISVGGLITRDLFGIPLVGIDVQMCILNQFNEEFTTQTNAKGQFLFSNLNYKDTIEVLIEARKDNGKKNLVIYLDVDSVLVKDYKLNAGISSEVYATKGRKQKRIPYTDPHKRVYEEGEPETNSLHSNPDQIIYMDKISYSPIGSVEDVLKQYVPGFYGSGENANFRGINSLFGSSQPLVLIDDVMVDYSAINSIAISDVHRIEILKGASAAIYGLRGATGAIAIYTKQGRYMKRGEILFNMLGYATAKEFYVPKFSAPESQQTPFPFTAFWNPQLITDNNGKLNLSFALPNVTGKFMLKIEGMDTKGRVGALVKEIEIMNGL